MPRRKRSTFGCVQEMRRGVWRIRWPEDTPHGRKRRSETVYGTRRDAERRLAEIRVHVGEDPGTTIGALWDQYVWPDYQDELAIGKKKPQTISQYVHAWEGFVRPRWGNVSVAALRPRDVQEWLLTISNGMGGKSLILLRAITAKAQFLELVDHDPLMHAFRLTEKKSRSREVPDLAGLGELWELCRGRWVEPAFLFCAHGGMRVGEACAIQPNDIEWRETPQGLVAVIHIQRQITEEQNVELPKYRSVRYTAISNPWATRLREIVEGLREDAVWVLDDGASDPEKLPSRKRVKMVWDRIIAGTRWDGTHLQKLRPAFETYMHWERKLPMERLRKMMGHKSVATTQRYDRPDDGTLVEAMVDAVLLGSS